MITIILDISAVYVYDSIKYHNNQPLEHIQCHHYPRDPFHFWDAPGFPVEK